MTLGHTLRPLAWPLLGLLAACEGDIGSIFGDDGGSDDGGSEDGGSGDGGGDDGADMLDREAYSDVSGNQGYHEIEVEVGPEHSAFLVTVESSAYPTLENLYDPDGNEVLNWEDWYDSNESLTSAFFWSGKTMAFNWPVRQEDGPLQQGTWTVKVSTIDEQGYYEGGADVDVSVMKKRDPDFAGGQVRVHIVWGQGVGDDPEVVTAMEGAVERWRQIWADAGIELVESWHDSDLDPEMTFAYNGSNEVESIAEGFSGHDLVLYVGDTIMNENGLYGIAGGVPGSIEPNNYTYVTLSWLAHAGGNGVFSEGEILMMGETAAHECGHFMGLFHPVEWSYDYWDALDDTDQCSSWQTCENNLGANLMFPYPICAGQSCVPQGDLTDQQDAVWQRYLGAL